MMRRDILEKAAEIPEILFPVFTNGTLLNDSYIKLFDQSRNLVPIFSIEGDEKKTNERRGSGIYQSLIRAMDKIKENHLIFGASVTATTSNLNEVVSDDFIHVLQERGCKVIIYVEFVPADVKHMFQLFYRFFLDFRTFFVGVIHFPAGRVEAMSKNHSVGVR